ncbi:MAG: hypothetical protein LBP42_02115 [Treponema sp.]|jgi:regulator of protease activity HflC (stomatin/prohibitin superfamily)|nr:hypothetical protein [Treponema sp.]
MDTASLPKTAPGESSPGGGSDENILQHLLQIESEAAALVNDAQAEADRRLTEGEKQNRRRYDEEYSREVAELDAGFDTEIKTVKEDYRRQLEMYQEGLSRITANTGNFSKLVENLLFSKPSAKEA